MTNNVPLEHITLAREFAAGSSLANETIERFLDAEMLAVPHPACPNILVTSSPADLILLAPP